MYIKSKFGINYIFFSAHWFRHRREGWNKEEKKEDERNGSSKGEGNEVYLLGNETGSLHQACC